MSTSVRADGWSGRELLAFALLLVAITNPKSLPQVVTAIWGRPTQGGAVVQTDEPLLTGPELADRLRVQPITVQRWGQTAKIPRIEISHKEFRYRWSDVKRALGIPDDSGAPVTVP